MQEDIQGSNGLVWYPKLDEIIGYTNYFYPVSFRPSSMEQMLYPPKFKKTGLVEAYYEGVSKLEDPEMETPYILAIRMEPGGTIWMMYKASMYDGEGGIFITTEDGTFVLEPIRNYFAKRVGEYSMEMA